MFLDTAGWWIAGTYPPDLTISQPFLTDPAIDPAKPAPPVGNEPRRWRRAPIEMQGKLDFKKVFNAENAATYALAIFDCPTDREVVFLWGLDDQMAFVLNGRHIPEDMSGFSPFGSRLSLVRVNAGRNTILAKVVNRKGEHSLNLMISQAHSDYLRAHVRLVQRWKEAVEDYQRARARDPSSLDVDLYRNGGTALAESGRWKEAAIAWQRGYELDSGDPRVAELAAIAHLAAEDLTAFRRIAAEMAEKYARGERWNGNNAVLRTIAMAPDPLKDYAWVLRWARGGRSPARDADALGTYGALLYRARRYDVAARYLRKATDARKGKGSASDWTFLAMALDHSRQPEYRQALAKAKELNKEPAPSWNQRVELMHLLKEAEREPSQPVK